MIRTPTVFVLGAGASSPYHLPLGGELRDQIYGSENTSGAISVAFQKLGIRRADVTNFARTFRRSNVNSIDAFLVRRQEFYEIGKSAIAACLCRWEDDNLLRQPKDEDDWYRYLWNKMIEETSSIDDLRQNQIRFVTFNYDRSLEQFLFNACKHAYSGVTDESALRAISSISILHVYGKLGEFHYADDDAGRRRYSPELSAQTLRTAAAGIQLIPAERGNDQNPTFAQARRWFEWADRICFLGFGYDRTNCGNLDLPSVLRVKTERNRTTTVYASGFDLTAAELHEARKVLCEGRVEWIPARSVCKNVMTLRELGVLP